MLEHSLWLSYAKEDLESARSLFSQPNVGIVSVVFHAQQCAEKVLKAYLVYQNISFSKSHDLLRLINSCAKIDEEFLSLELIASELNPYAIKTRYPDSYYPIPDISSAEMALQHASKIYEFTLTKINRPLKQRDSQKEHNT